MALPDLSKARVARPSRLMKIGFSLNIFCRSFELEIHR